MTECDCRPTEGFHAHACAISRRMRIELREAGKPPQPPDPTKRAQVVAWHDWGDDDNVRSCGIFRHDWDQGHDPGGACCTATIRYTCRTCGKTKDKGSAS